MFAFVAFTIVREHGGHTPVQRYVALAYAQAMCLRRVCIALEPLLAWRGGEGRSKGRLVETFPARFPVLFRRVLIASASFELIRCKLRVVPRVRKTSLGLQILVVN